MLRGTSQMMNSKGFVRSESDINSGRCYCFNFLGANMLMILSVLPLFSWVESTPIHGAALQLLEGVR